MEKHQFLLGDWLVDSTSNSLHLGKTKKNVEPKAMDVLLLLCQQAGTVISADDLVEQCWPEGPVGDNPLHKTITQLRRALGDKASAPIFIETIRKRGYRVIAPVQFVSSEQTRASETDWQGGSPFPGLKAFSPAESQIYFGRHELVQRLLTRLADQCSRKRPFSLIIGPSGSGKSSLIHAGVLPKLLDKKSGSSVHTIDYVSIDMSDVTPKAIIEEIAASMLDWDIGDKPVFEGESTHSLTTLLLNNPEHVVLLAKKSIKAAGDTKLAAFACFTIVIDRLEAYLTTNAVDKAEKNTVFAVLETLSQSGVFMLLLVSRNDFYPLLANFPALMRNKDRGAHFDVTPPTSGELSQMIRLPAIAAGLEWEQDDKSTITLDDTILADASLQPDCLPLLQYTLQELYMQKNGNTLLHDTYQKLGGIDGAIGQRAEQRYDAMPQNVQNALQHVLPLIVQITEDGRNLTSRTAGWDELEDDSHIAFVELMVESRLFVSELHQSKPCFKVAHEAVLRRWHRVQDWLKQHQSALVSKRRLEQQTKQWIDDQRSQAFLLTEGKPLSDAVALLADGSVKLSDNEKGLIAASQKKQKQKKLLKRTTVGALACLTVISFCAMLFSFELQKLAERKRLEAEDLMGFMIGDFANTLRSVKRMDLLEGISNQAISYVENAQQQSNSGLFNVTQPSASFELRFQHALSLQAMAEVRFYRDDIDTAKSHYEDADRRLAALLDEQPNNTELLKAAGVNAFWLGHIAYEANRSVEAQRAMQQYLTLSKALLSLLPDDADAVLEVAYAYNSLGSLAYKEYNFNVALAHFQQSLSYKEKYAAKAQDTILAETYIADTYSWVASSQLNQGDITNATVSISNAVAILSALLQQSPNNAAIVEAYTYTLVRHAEIMQLSGKYKAAIDTLMKAHDILAIALRQDPNNSAWKTDEIKISAALLTLSTNADVNIEKHVVTEHERNVREYLREKPESITFQLHHIRYLQNAGKWQASRQALDAVLALPASSDLLAAKTIYTNNNERVINLHIALIRQAFEENMENSDTTRCKSLLRYSNELIKVSSKPNYHIAYAYAAQCVGLHDDVEKTLRTINAMDAVFPPFLHNNKST
ncbi:winged helix-turn-helix domain-containing protein [Alteromonas sp. A079]|uniref:nSTAND1 domain-containing NTPase n=1 Tax=Alteromonas sp. A079 TaxID=3410268 RepID=UPI003BA0EE19